MQAAPKYKVGQTVSFSDFDEVHQAKIIAVKTSQTRNSFEATYRLEGDAATLRYEDELTAVS